MRRQDPNFALHLSGFVNALNIRQGDYCVTDFTERGLMVSFGPQTEGEPSVPKKELPNSKKFEEPMLKLLKNAIRNLPYHIAVKRPWGKEAKTDSSLQSNSELNKKLNTEIDNILPPVFEFYSENGELVASLFLNHFILVPNHYAEAAQLMKKIGTFVFECRDGPLMADFDPAKAGGMRNLQKWYEELVNWKR